MNSVSNAFRIFADNNFHMEFPVSYHCTGHSFVTAALVARQLSLPTAMYTTRGEQRA
jgi:hypothetical protein